MIEEQAQVIDIKGTQLLLQAQTQSVCGGCAVNKSCGTSLLAKVVGRKFTHFQAANNINAKIGDTVVVGLDEDALLKGSLVMYVIPIMAMIVFALLADFLLKGSLQIEANTRDLTIAATSIMGLVFGSFVARWYFRRQSSVRQFAPIVLRKIISHE
ncbi:MAG: hypothetical protein COB77_02220 [Gammaproteobacteria bacterium]|nr:MAG: hypothetical protein COB77_02220 [Gammaproteobacteria bacterium]